jgi:hypothetical protein
MTKLVLLFTLVSCAVFSQDINNYKYVIVPKKFAIFNEQNKYNLNTSSKLLLEKYGFIAVMDDEIPTEIANNRCQSLFMDLIDNNGLLVTKLKIVLKDCAGAIVYETALGRSREKSFDIAFRSAFREAAKSFETLNYKYNGVGTVAVVAVKQSKLNNETVITDSNETSIVAAEPSKTVANNALYAQPISNGFQLVNTEPKVMYKIYTTSNSTVFIGFKGTQQGVFLKKNTDWYFEYYHQDKFYVEQVAVKF